jgi:peptidoglycan hydrolase-like protein with peptidoglycan-binding domain
MASRRLSPAAAVVIAALALVPAAGAKGRAGVAALQVGLRGQHLYVGTIDGFMGPETVQSVRDLQRRAGLTVDGVVGPRTRAALGRFARHRLGTRVLARGVSGWDVAALQYELAWHGFPSGPLDGHFGLRTERALRLYQRFAALEPDGVAGQSVLRALRTPPPRSPVALAWPLEVPVSDGFGPRGNRFHSGLDFPAPLGTPIEAAASGRVTFAGWYRAGGYGYLVTVAHGRGVRTLYAHLSSVGVRVGQRVGAGAELGRVGATGDASGPHLHFEVRVRGAAIDPLTALG